MHTALHTSGDRARRCTADVRPTRPPVAAQPLDVARDRVRPYRIRRRDVWTIPTAPYKGAHYATYPPALPRRLIHLMCPRQVCTVCGEPRRRIVEPVTSMQVADADKAPGTITTAARYGSTGRDRTVAVVNMSAQYTTLGWTDCDWRRRPHAPSAGPTAATTTTAAATSSTRSPAPAPPWPPPLNKDATPSASTSTPATETSSDDRIGLFLEDVT